MNQTKQKPDDGAALREMSGQRLLDEMLDISYESPRIESLYAEILRRCNACGKLESALLDLLAAESLIDDEYYSALDAATINARAALAQAKGE